MFYLRTYGHSQVRILKFTYKELGESVTIPESWLKYLRNMSSLGERYFFNFDFLKESFENS